MIRSRLCESDMNFRVYTIGRHGRLCRPAELENAISPGDVLVVVMPHNKDTRACKCACM